MIQIEPIIYKKKSEQPIWEVTVDNKELEINVKVIGNGFVIGYSNAMKKHIYLEGKKLEEITSEEAEYLKSGFSVDYYKMLDISIYEVQVNTAEFKFFF